jgi:SAM-dependent methyltransferase
MLMYDQVIADLRQAYDLKVDERDQKEVTPWQREQRDRFLSLLQVENKRKLLEIGAGTGVHGKFFQDSGLAVICTDLSSEMVKRCQQKGLTAYGMDFLHLDFPAKSFDAVYAMKCLLHVPRSDLPRVLGLIQNVLKLDGLFYLGQYGGVEREGVWSEDHYEPKRFFSFLPDAEMERVVGEFFEVVEWKQIPLAEDTGMHFQSMILRKSWV